MAAVKRNPDRDGEYEGAVAFTLTKPVSLGHLDVELQKEMGWEQVAGMNAEGDPATASAQDPVTIWIYEGAGKVDGKKVSKVVTAHDKPVSPGERLRDLSIKAAQGEDFTAEELQEAVRGLLLRVPR